MKLEVHTKTVHTECIFLKIIFGVLCLLFRKDSMSTVSKVGERKGVRLGKGPHART